jgi:hypothetical protein
VVLRHPYKESWRRRAVVRLASKFVVGIFYLNAVIFLTAGRRPQVAGRRSLTAGPLTTFSRF